MSPAVFYATAVLVAFVFGFFVGAMTRRAERGRR